MSKLAPLLLLGLLPLGLLSSRCEPIRDIVVVGDSITAGQVVGGGTGYVELVQAALPDRVVTNAGCGLATSQTALEEPAPVHVGVVCLAAFQQGQLPAMVAPAFPVEVAVILFGVNDALFGASCQWGYTPCDPDPIEPEAYEANIREIIHRLHEFSVVKALPIVVLMKPPLRNDPSRFEANVRIWRYGDRLQAICDEEPGVLCGPDLRTLLHAEHYEAGELIHPNAQGHRAIAAALLAFLDEAGLLATPGAEARYAGTVHRAPAAD